MQENVFVGREQELRELKGHLGEALLRKGRVCFVTGEAGSGKTALVRHFMHEALSADSSLVVFMGSCNAQIGIGDPYLPFREALTMLTSHGAGQQADKVTPENTYRLRAVLVRSVQVLVETAPELVGLFVPGATLVGALGKAVAKKTGWMDRLDELAARKPGPGELVVEQGRIFEQYTAFLRRLSAHTPLILFLDDLQWADNASLGLLFHLGRQIESSRILILGAYRPNDVALGRDGTRHPLEPVVHELTRYYGDVTVDLDAIPHAVHRRFVDSLIDAEPNRLGPSFRQLLFHRTGGHALFTAELIRTLRERGDLVRDGDGRWAEGPSLDWDALPVKVEGVIAERIDRLSEGLKEMLRVASVEGEQFTAEVVARVEAIAAREAIRQLSSNLEKQHRLVSAQGMVQLGALRLSIYRFWHNLFQQYLYGGLDEVERAYLHRDMGEAMEGLFAGDTEEEAAQLARHFEEGGVPAKAATYRLQAGARAHRMSAHEEAAFHLTRGLELVADLPPGPERIQVELGLQLSLGTVLAVTRAHASPEVQEAYTRARELCRALGDPPETIPVLYGLCQFTMTRGEIRKAHVELEQLLLLADEAGNIGYQVGCHVLLGASSLYQGELERSRGNFERAVALYDESRDRDLAHQQGMDPAVLAHIYLSWVDWFRGYPEQAVPKMEEGLRLAADLDHPYTSTMAAFFASTFHQLMRQWPECHAQAERVLGLEGGQQFGFWLSGCAMLRASALAHQGCADESVAVLQRELAAWDATGDRVAQPYFRAHLAEACLLAGRREEGLKALEESFGYEEEVWWQAEQHRLRAELLQLAPGNEVEAEATLRQALAVARSQKSKSLELRAAMSLARLLRQAGRAAEGRDLLGECYAWFTEGFDTADLREARGLLEELTPSPNNGTGRSK